MSISPTLMVTDNLMSLMCRVNYLYALKEDLTLLWRVVVNEETSGNTGCTLFDFNGDGQSEIVYRDEKYIYIINGTNGSIFTQQTCVSRTNREYPIVADVDADGNTELCVTCRTVDFIQNGAITDPTDPNYFVADDANFCSLPNAEFSQVRVFRSGAEPWVPARAYGISTVTSTSTSMITFRFQEYSKNITWCSRPTSVQPVPIVH